MTLEEQLEEGRRQWTIAWRRFARQWTQPQLLKLTDAVVGGRHLHSSQISGFATGKLREPAPKIFIVIGNLNQAIASRQAPIEYRELWEGKQVIRDKNKNALDSVGCFLAFTGQIDLGFGESLRIPEEMAADASRRLGRFMRQKLSMAGIDFIEDLKETTCNYSPEVKSLLIGQTVDAKSLEVLVPEIERLMESVDISLDINELWNVMFNMSMTSGTRKSTGSSGAATTTL